MVRNMIKGASMLMLLSALSLVAVVSAKAQNSARAQYADIPFNFMTGDKELSAGRYRVARIDAGGVTISVRGVEGSEGSLAMTNTINHLNPSTQSKLVFHKYGNSYFLSEVWIEGDTTGRQFRETKQEKSARRELTASRQYQRVEVAIARD